MHGFMIGDLGMMGSLVGPPGGPDATHLIYRLRGDDAASDVSSWPTAAGSNPLAPAITGTPTKLDAALNGHAAVEVYGGNYVTLPVAISEPMTMLAVAKFVSGSRGFAWQVGRSVGGFGGGGNWGFYNAGGAVDLGVDSHEWGLISLTLASASSYASRINGVNLVAGIVPVPVPGYDALQFGADGAGGSFGDCMFAEFLVFNAVLSYSVRKAWEDFLAATYALGVSHFDRAGLLLELIADFATDGTVAAWSDSSGNGHDFAQSNAAKRPAKIASAINGHAVVADGGAGNFLNSSWTVPTSGTLIAVVQFSDPTTYEAFFDYDTSVGQYTGIGTSGAGFHRSLRTNGLGSAAGTAAEIWVVLRDDPTSQLYVNGVLDIASQNAGWGTPSGSGARILLAGDNSAGMNGGIAHLLFFSGILDADTRQGWEDYLSALYAIPVTR